MSILSINPLALGKSPLLKSLVSGGLKKEVIDKWISEESLERTRENRIEMFYKIDEDSFIKGTMLSSKLKQEYVNSFPLKTILLDSHPQIVSIIKNSLKLPPLSNLYQLKWGTSQSGYSRKIKEKPGLGLRKFAATENIDNFFLSDKSRYIPESIFPKSQRTKLENPKIVVARQSIKLKSAIDFEGYYLGKVSFFNILSNETGFYMLALLNSKLLDFIFKKLYELLYLGGGFIYTLP